MDKEAIMTKVYVKWFDPVTDHGWEPIADLEVRYHCVESVGFLIKESEDCICISMNLDREFEEVNGITMIPRVLITEMREIELGENIQSLSLVSN
jgi:hypothetical protein